jgi:hypothetical protein
MCLVNFFVTLQAPDGLLPALGGCAEVELGGFLVERDFDLVWLQISFGNLFLRLLKNALFV